MKRLLGSGLILSIIATTGCVSSETHSRALGNVNEARKAATDARNELDSFKKQSSVDMDAKEAERARLAGELAAAQSALASARSNVGVSKVSWMDERMPYAMRIAVLDRSRKRSMLPTVRLVPSK